MDLQVYLIIVTVFFVSLGSLLFVNRQLRAGKTFEEVLAEKRQLTDKLYGNKKKNAKKANTGKKVRISLWLLSTAWLNYFFSLRQYNCRIVIAKKPSSRKQLPSNHQPLKVMENLTAARISMPM